MVQEQSNMEDNKEPQDVRRPESQEGIWTGDPVLAQPKKGKSRVGLYIALVVVLALLGAGATYLFLQSQGKGQPASTGEEASSGELTQVQEPTPTPTVAFDKSLWTLEVLNGTTTPGLAAKVAAELKEMGYEVVKTGNADRTDYEDTQVLVSSSMKTQSSGLIGDLDGNWGISGVDGDLTGSTASARIVLGANAVPEEIPSEETEE